MVRVAFVSTVTEVKCSNLNGGTLSYKRVCLNVLREPSNACEPHGSHKDAFTNYDVNQEDADQLFNIWVILGLSIAHLPILLKNCLAFSDRSSRTWSGWLASTRSAQRSSSFPETFCLRFKYHFLERWQCSPARSSWRSCFKASSCLSHTWQALWQLVRRRFSMFSSKDSPPPKKKIVFLKMGQSHFCLFSSFPHYAIQ